ncbi:acyltransferase [Inquilinus sp. KBS0705]|nr:acyltransferase [Inquilinus sp. KBS0705]
MTKNADPYHPAKLYGLDHLRAFAISFVVIFHYQSFGHPNWVNTLGSFGWTGVDLFFVLSGFLISSQLFAELSNSQTISLKNFFVKRSFRILPGYWLVLAIYYFIPAFREREALPPIWKHLTFTQNIGLNIATGGTFSHAWSLCVEEQFYLLLPLALLLIYRKLLLRKGAYILALIALLGFAIRAFSWYHLVTPHQGADDFFRYWYMYIYYPIYNRLDGLLMGIAVSALLHYQPVIAKKIAKYGNWLLPLGLAILAFAYWLCIDQHSYQGTIFGFPVVALGYGAIVLCAVSGGSVLYKYKSFITEKLAGLSYGIYLIHKGIIHLVQQHLESHSIPKNGNLMFVLCMISVIIGAILLQLVVERPMLKLRKMVLSKG